MNNSTSPSSMTRRSFVTTAASALTTFGLLGATAFGGSNESKDTSIDAPNEILFNGAFDSNGMYALPALPYNYNALEPYIDGTTMQLHHDKHFAAYMNGLNAALRDLQEAQKTGNYSNVSLLENELAFNGAGYVLHTVFFQNMAPGGNMPASESLMDTLASYFHTFDAFKAHFSAVANAVQGSGWAILGYQPLGNRLVILQVTKHQDATQWGIVPILVLDIWEHAYYLKYHNRRKDYVEAWWHVVNWKNVESRLQAAQSLFSPAKKEHVGVTKIPSKYWC